MDTNKVAAEQKKPARKPRGFKIALIVILCLLVLLAAGVYFLPYLLPIDTIREIARNKSKELIGQEVDFKTFRFGWNGSVVLEGVTLTPLAGEGKNAEPVLSVDEVRTNVAVSPLFSGKIVVDSVEVDGLKVKVRRDAQGVLNLPDFSKLSELAAAPQATPPTSRRMLLSALAADTPPVVDTEVDVSASVPASSAAPAVAAPAGDLPPIEVHRIELKSGIVGYADELSGMDVDVGLDSFRIDGGNLEEPFLLAGRVLPYPGEPGKGEFPVTGRIAMIKNGALDLEKGEASLEIDVKSFAPADLVVKLGLPPLLESGLVNGVVKLGFAEGRGLVAVDNMQLTTFAVKLDEQLRFDVPESAVGIQAEFDPQSGTVNFHDAKLSNRLVELQSQGWVEGIYGLAEGTPPVAAVEYAGKAEFAPLLGYLSGLGVSLDSLPEITGDSSFSGKAVLGKPQTPDAPLSPTLSLEVADGKMAVRDKATGIAADVVLTGISLRAAAALAQPLHVNSSVDFKNTPVAAVVPQLTGDAINATASGSLRCEVVGEAVEAELVLQDALVKMPATPWSGTMEIHNPTTQLFFNMARDEIRLQETTFTATGGIAGKVETATFTGVLAGKPQGKAVMDVAAQLGPVKELFQPLIPAELASVAGAAKARTVVTMDGQMAALATSAEADQVGVGVNAAPDLAAALETPKAALSLSARTNLSNPLLVEIAQLDLGANGGTLRMTAPDGISVSARLGNATMKTSGIFDISALRAEVPGLSLNMGGLSAAIGKDGVEAAGVNSGLVQLVVGGPDKKLLVPLNGTGDFNVPSLLAQIDNLIFHRLVGENKENSDFGTLKASLAVDGYLGTEKRQIISLNSAQVSAKPLVANLIGKFDLGTSEFVARYAARMAPAGMTSLLSFLNLPPALLSDVLAQGEVSWQAGEAKSRAAVKGSLRLGSEDVNPFEMNHDISAILNREESSLTVSINALNGNVKTAAGEQVVVLKSDQSRMFLSRGGSKGYIDIRLDGAAGPTRMLVLGVTGMVPQLREYSNILYNSVADGVYSAWLQISDKDSAAIALKMGGFWQGAALRINNVPFLAEAGKLYAGLEGEFAYRENRISLTKLEMQSDSAQARAVGTADVALAVGADQAISGVGNVSLNMQFNLNDLTKLALVFPGAVPADLGLMGKIAGAFTAAGDVNNIQVQQSAVQFQGFQAHLGGVEMAIPSGTANFGGNLALVLDAQMTGSPYDVLKFVNVAGGQAALTGAHVLGRAVNSMTSAFNLQNGVLALQSAELSIAEGDGAAAGGVSATGSVDFNSYAPAVNVRLAVRNMPLSIVNQDLADYLQFHSGVVNMPAAQGQAANIAFNGLSEDEILRTIRLDGFTFATGPVTIHTGPVLNAELNKARGLMRMEATNTGEAKVITLTSLTGTATAAGNGVIVIPSENPIEVIGDNTGDFRVQGSVSADHTMDLTFFVAGKLENIIGFTLPNLIPNIRSGTDEEKNKFMAKMNENAAAGHYSVRITGPLDRPNLSGIGELAGRFVADIFKAAPGQIIGGAVDLVKDAPGTLKNLGVDAAGAILNAPETIVNAPKTVINAPKNITKGIGRMFGLGGSHGSSNEEGGEQEPAQE